MPACPSCSAENSDTSKFCSECGAALSPEYAATVTGGSRVEGPGSREPTGDSSHSGSSQHGRFLPGTKIADRYRIVSLVGKGGMGEVYRADDLKLGHTVALKFLPRDLADDANRLEYFHGEVRLTRQISHPNVCRVYDIGDVDGEHFLSMEYVDGEDLRVLLRRIGRLPRDKGVQIAQQLCAGLAAAHEKGVLHRDLKPANIMLDGRGQVRITDFGLARLAEDGKEGEIAGTPRYMAPEQLACGETTIQSDLYSLGLILYELFTGEAVHKGGTVRELLQAHEESGISHPSNVVDDMDPVVERVILRCLEKAPHERPKSAHAVAAALPGGDPLAAALAAGETPSPEMVAAAGETAGLSPRVAVACLSGVALCLLVTCWLADRTDLVNRVDLPSEPAVLAVKAQELVQEDLGYDDPPHDAIHGFMNEDESLRFWYRQRYGDSFTVSSFWREPNDPEPSRARPSFRIPPWDDPAELGVQLTPGGTLRYFRARPSLGPNATDKPSDSRWADWFSPETTGFVLPQDGVDSIAPARESDAPVLTIVREQSRTPPDAFDALAVWKGVDEQSGEEFYVEAAAFQGKPVYFEVFSRSRFEEEWEPPTENLGGAVWSWLSLLLAAGGGVLIWHNLRTGRGDRRGAMRLAVFLFSVSIVIFFSRSHHSSSASGEFQVIALGFAGALYDAACVWWFYIAGEPLVRRIWPQILISWARLLEGRIRDATVGRDLLLGALGGVGISVLFRANSLAHLWILQESANPLGMEPLTLSGSGVLLGEALDQLIWAAVVCAFLLIQLLFFRLLLRSKPLAVVTWCVWQTVFLVLARESSFAIALLPMALIAITHLLLLVRFGFLALVVQMTTYGLATWFPLTLNPEHWYFTHGLFAIVWIAAIAVYGFYTSLGGRPVFAAGVSKGAPA